MTRRSHSSKSQYITQLKKMTSPTLEIMSEVTKHGIYPGVPKDSSAYRLSVCSSILETMNRNIESDTKKRDEKLRKHSRLRIINIFSTSGATVLSVSGAGVSISVFGVVVGAPLISAGFILGITSFTTTILDKEVIRKMTIYEKLISLGQAKVSSLQEMVGKALSDENVSEMEFKKISDERQSYDLQRSEILRPPKKGTKKISKCESFDRGIVEDSSAIENFLSININVSINIRPREQRLEPSAPPPYEV